MLVKPVYDAARADSVGGNGGVAPDGHRAISDALEAQDAVQAHAAMQRYLELSYVRLVMLLRRRARPRAAASAAMVNVLTCSALPEP